MVGRRQREQAELAAIVRERLAHLLAEQRPRGRTDPASGPPRPAVSPPAQSALAYADDDDFDSLIGGMPAGEQDSVRPLVDPIVEVREPGHTSDPAGADQAGFDQEVRIPRRLFSRTHLMIVAGLLVMGLMAAGWAVLRAKPVALATPVASAPADGATTVPTAGAPTVATPSPVPTMIKIHVAGAVKKPGVFSLPDGARVDDALTAAGGLTGDADPGDLNLAQVLGDGQQVLVGTKKDPAGEVRDDSGSTGSSNQPGETGGSGQQLDLNSATAVQLETLPGVGPVTAGKIMAWREDKGRFSRVEELQEVDGIGPKTYAEISPHVRV